LAATGEGQRGQERGHIGWIEHRRLINAQNPEPVNARSAFSSILPDVRFVTLSPDCAFRHSLAGSEAGVDLPHICYYIVLTMRH
jgi:hypothetical protein